jgi:MurNAc alpha-1-phosphate uridylyltransferase
VTLMEETPLVLETGGGLKNALPVLGGDPVMTLNADAVWTGPMAARTLRGAWDPDRMDGLLLLVPLARAHGRAGDGDFALTQAGTVTRDSPDLVYTGAGIVRTDALAAISEPAFSLRALWAPMLAENRLHGIVHTGHWADVGHPAGIAAAEAMLAEHGQ